MIKIENGTLEVDGSAIELIKDWANITYALCKKMSEATGVQCQVKDLIDASTTLYKEEQQCSIK